MSSEQQLADHWLKRNETLNAFILFEGGALSQEMLQIMMEHYKYRRISLYQLPDLKKVAAYGPGWFVLKVKRIWRWCLSGNYLSQALLSPNCSWSHWRLGLLWDVWQNAGWS